MAADLNDLDSLGSDEEEMVVLPAGSRHYLPPQGGGGGGASAAASFSAAAAAADAASEGSGSSGEGDSATEPDDDDAIDGGGGGGGGGGASRKRRRGEELPGDEALDAELLAASAAAPAGAPRGLASVARLRGTARYRTHLAAVRSALGEGGGGGGAPAPVVGPLDEWPEYKLLVSSTALIAACDDEMFVVHRFLVDVFSARFPQLASMVPAPADFVRCVALIGNETDLSRVDLPSVLPPSAVMVVTATGSTTMGPPLPAGALAEARAAGAEWAELAAGREALLRFVETRMAAMAPNVAAMLGARVGAQLLACAGGLTALSRAPSCNVQVMGSKRRTGAAAAAAGARAAERPHKHAGVIFEAALVAEAPHALQRRAAKTLAAKVVLAARMDAFGEGRAGGGGGGGGGAALLAGVAAKVAKWQEPPPPRAHKPLKAPDEVKKKRRGGRRARAMRETLGVTDVRREANRLAVSGGAHEYGDFAMGVEAGMLGTGATATGRLRVEAKAQKRILGAGAAKRLKAAGAFGGGAAAGTLSTFDFTAPQGMEFVAGGWAGGRAPRSAAAAAGAGSVFDNSGTFSAMPR